MGLDYSFLTYFPRERVWDALDGLAAIADLAGVPTRLTMPDSILSLPFTAWAGTDAHLRWDDRKPEWDFMTVLCFPPDPPLREYFAGQPELPDLIRGCFPLGFIYLTVYNDLTVKKYGERSPDLVLFRFTAATSMMSILFTESTSIRRTFNELLKDHGGLCGLLDMEDGGGLVTWWQGRELSVEIYSPRAPLAEIEAEIQRTGQ